MPYNLRCQYNDVAPFNLIYGTDSPPGYPAWWSGELALACGGILRVGFWWNTFAGQWELATTGHDHWNDYYVEFVPHTCDPHEWVAIEVFAPGLPPACDEFFWLHVSKWE